jgi:3-deoxy-D-manno-octulosonic-acid transferase
MGELVHGVSMRMYRLLIRLAAAAGHAKARGWLAMRVGGLDALRNAESRLADGQQWMWFHCASVGEYEQARPVMEAWRARHPDDAFLLTFYSPSGWNTFAKRQPPWWQPTDHAAALPLDVSPSVQAFLSAAGGSDRLRGLLFAKYDVWPVLVHVLDEWGVPTGLFAGHVLPGRWPFRRGGAYHRSAWRKFRCLWVQNQESVQTLAGFGLAAEAAGDPRFDRVLQAVEHHAPDEELTAWISGRPCAVVGSAWEAEVNAALDAWRPGTCVIVVPHEWSAASIQVQSELWRSKNATPVVWSEHRTADARTALPPGDVLLVDVMGELLDLYAVADVAVVGGGFGQGVHNTLEPAAHGAGVLVGPRVGRFAEVAALQAAGALRVCASPHELCVSLASVLANPAGIRASGKAARDFALQHAGAGQHISKGWSDALDLT